MENKKSKDKDDNKNNSIYTSKESSKYKTGENNQKDMALIKKKFIMIRGKKIALFKFFFPFLLAFIGVGLLYIIIISLYDWYTFKFIGITMIIYLIGPIIGKETLIPAAVAGPENLNKLIEKLPIDIDTLHGHTINPFIIAMSIAFIDIIVSLFLVWNYDLSKKIPIFRRIIIKIEKKFEELQYKKPWFENLAFTGIVLFVMFPLQWSGGAVGSIAGRAIGLNPFKVWSAVLIGSITGCLLVAYTSYAVIDLIKSHGSITMILILTGIIFFIIFSYKKMVISRS